MKKKIIYSLGIITMAVLAVGFYAYQKVLKVAVEKDTVIYIKSGSTFDDLLMELKPKINDVDAFKQVAKWKRFNKPRTGKFTIKKGTSVNGLVNRLRLKGEAVKVIFNNQDRLESLAGRVAQQLEVDSLTLLNAMRDSQFLQNNGFTEKSVLGMYVPNQYELFWTASAEKFRDKMLKEYKRFWNKERKEKARKLGLTAQEIITVASIVQKETSKVSERPMVAGLYLNRIKVKMNLQADPTIIFALKEKNGYDKVYKRVLFKDLEIDSPYNTYVNGGIPPSLIAMPDISSIDAVLNSKNHDYLYMCASIEKMGYHDFAKTLAQHNRNANKYRVWISQQGINR